MPSDGFVTVYDPYRLWMVIPEASALLLILWLWFCGFREDVIRQWRRGEPLEIGGTLGVLVVLGTWAAVTSQVPTPAWAVFGGPAQVVEGPVENLQRGKPGRVSTLDFTVSGTPVHIYGEGRRAALVNLSTERGGPVRDGLRVRVSLRAGKVLKFELRE